MGENLLKEIFGMLDATVIIRDVNGSVFYQNDDKISDNLKHIHDDVFLDNVNNKYYKKTVKNIGENTIETYSDITKFIEESNKYSVDPLTNLPLRAKINEYLMDIAKTRNSYVVAMVDIDNFKTVNDTYGHDIGDVVLKEVASIFSKNIRIYDFAGRYGGEEFLLIFKANDIQMIMTRLDNIRGLVNSYIFDANGFDFNISISIGLTSYTPEFDNINAKIKQADEALYYVKNNGKNAVALYNENMRNNSKNDSSLYDENSRNKTM